MNKCRSPSDHVYEQITAWLPCQLKKIFELNTTTKNNDKNDCFSVNIYGVKTTVSNQNTC